MSRKCPVCEKMHDTVLQVKKTGEVEEEFNLCRYCLIASSVRYGPVLGKIYITADDCSDQHIADQMAATLNYLLAEQNRQP